MANKHSTRIQSDRFEWYPTPNAFSEYLFATIPIEGRCFAPCHGDGAIERSGRLVGPGKHWITNDLDPRWPSDYHEDATADTLRRKFAGASVDIDWVVDNPAFSIAIEVIEEALKIARVGVAMHLRASIHEVLKRGPRRTWMAEHTPTGLLWLPRFGYQRSPKTGQWSQDSCCACWVIWMKDPKAPQFIHYCPEKYLKKLADDTAVYRARVDAQMKVRHRAIA